MSNEWIVECCRRTKDLIEHHRSACRSHVELLTSLNAIAEDSMNLLENYFEYLEKYRSFAPASLKNYVSTFNRFFDFYFHRRDCTVSPEGMEECKRSLAILGKVYSKATRYATRNKAMTQVSQLMTDRCWPIDGIKTIRDCLLVRVAEEETYSNNGYRIAPDNHSRRIGNLIVALYTFAIQPRIGYIESLIIQNILDAMESGMECTFRCCNMWMNDEYLFDRYFCN